MIVSIHWLVKKKEMFLKRSNDCWSLNILSDRYRNFLTKDLFLTLQLYNINKYGKCLLFFHECGWNTVLFNADLKPEYVITLFNELKGRNKTMDASAKF